MFVFTLKFRLPQAARKLPDKSITLCIKNYVHAILAIINHSTLIVFSSLTKKGKMNRLAVISIVLSVLTIQASGKSDLALKLLKKAIGFMQHNFFYVFRKG